MIETIGARTLIYGPSQAERAAALQAALPELRIIGLGDASVGPDCSHWPARVGRRSASAARARTT